MKTIITTIAILFSALMLQAQNTITVSMHNFDNNKGTVKVGLYDSEGNFLNKEFMTRGATISGEKAAVTFTDVPDGTYAISCYHDENDNDKLDMMMGIMPSEDYGCSNGAKGFFGPPKWKDAKFTIENGETKAIDIKL